MGRMRMSVEERDHEERAKSLQYISDPMQWVTWLCPIKRRAVNGGPPETAYLFCNEPVIRYGNIFNAKPDDREERFANFRAIIDAGWVVD